MASERRKEIQMCLHRVAGNSLGDGMEVVLGVMVLVWRRR
jgi:hypothetical protein